MITNPKHGWCNFKLGNFEGTPSYITDTPAEILQAFINRFNNGYGMVWFDEEGTDFSLILTPYSTCIIKNDGENNLFFDFSNYNEFELAREVISDIENNIDEWKWWDPFEDPEDESAVNQNANEYKRELEALIAELNLLLKRYGR